MTYTGLPGLPEAAVIWMSSSVSTRLAARSSPLDLQHSRRRGRASCTFQRFGLPTHRQPGSSRRV